MAGMDTMDRELMLLIVFGLCVLGLAYMVVMTIVRNSRRRRAWDRVGDDLGWKGTWSKNDVGVERLEIQGQHRDRDMTLTASLGVSATTPECPVVGACKLSLDNLSMKPFALICRWDTAVEDRGFRGLGYIVRAVILLLDTFTSVFGEKRRSRDYLWWDFELRFSPDLATLDVSGMPIGEGTVLFGEPVEAVKAVVARPEVAQALLAFMGPRQSGWTLVNAPDRNGEVRVQVTMDKLRVASNKKLPPAQWQIPADLLVVLAHAIEELDAGVGEVSD